MKLKLTIYLLALAVLGTYLLFNSACNDEDETVDLFTLSLQADPNEGGIVNGGGTYQEAEVIAITAIPNEAYEFLNWTNQQDEVLSFESEFDYTMPAQDVSLTANFKLGQDSTGSVTDYDGNVYPTIKICDQWWMAENLKTTHFADGTSVPLIESPSVWEDLGYDDKAFCYYNNNANDEAGSYGALYTWAAAMNGAQSSEQNPSGIQGICPDGWHLPSIAEWEELIECLGDTTTAGGKMKETGTEHWNTPNTGATNVSGFTARPGGYRGYNGSFYNLGKTAHFWSATESQNSLAYYLILRYDGTEARPDDFTKYYGFSIRCIKD